MIDSIGSSNAHDILFDDNSDSPVPDILQKLLTDTYDSTTFIDFSKKLADHLNKIQSAINPGGFILVFCGLYDNKKIIGILKLEKEEGAQLHQSQRDGKNTFEITNINNLILSKNTRLYKVAVFFKESDEFYFGSICDNQLNGKGNVANFFLRHFLGCQLKVDYAIETRNFYNHSIGFIKQNINDPLIQNECKLFLQSYVLNKEKTINAKKFALTYLDIEHRSKYEKYLYDKEIPKSILKDTSYIENAIKKHLFKFENGIQIIGTNDDFEEQVQLESLENGNTRAIVESYLQKI